MSIININNDFEYQKAVELLEQIGDDQNFENDDKLIEQFNALLNSIKEYEQLNFAMKDGDPIEIIKLKMNFLELKPKDLIPFIGSKGVISEVLNKKRRLSKSMIRKISLHLKIDQRLLNVEYEIFPVKFEPKNNNCFFSDLLYEQTKEFTGQVINRGLLFNVCAYN